jgi:hypothetical protein
MELAVRTQHFSHTPPQTTAFFASVLSIGVRQGPLPKFQVDLESVASPWGSSQTGNWVAGWVNLDIFPEFVFYTE